jgi:hypothetical protein
MYTLPRNLLEILCILLALKGTHWSNCLRAIRVTTQTHRLQFRALPTGGAGVRPADGLTANVWNVPRGPLGDPSGPIGYLLSVYILRALDDIHAPNTSLRNFRTALVLSSRREQSMTDNCNLWGMPLWLERKTYLSLLFVLAVDVLVPMVHPHRIINK